MLANEVLEKTYLALKQDRTELCFQNPVYAEIANNGFEKGYTTYKLCFILDEAWIISFGRKCGKHPAKEYDCDIVVMPLDFEKSVEEILQNNNYFFYSPIFCYSTGEFAVRKESFFSSEMIRVVTNLGEYEVKKGVYDERIVEHLREKIIKILS